MHVSTDLLIWNDAHMQSRAKIQHVAVLTGNCLKFNFPNVVLRFSSVLVTKVLKKLHSVECAHSGIMGLVASR